MPPRLSLEPLPNYISRFRPEGLVQAELTRLGFEKVSKQAVEKILAWVADDPPDLAAILNQYECRRYSYRPFKQHAGKQLISNVISTQWCNLPLGRQRICWADFGVPTSAPRTARVLEHDKLGRTHATVMRDESAGQHQYGESYPLRDVHPGLSPTVLF
jgi:hypothetical protein